MEGDCVYTLSGHTSFVYSLTVLPNGDIVSGGEDRTVRIWRGQSPPICPLAMRPCADVERYRTPPPPPFHRRGVRADARPPRDLCLGGRGNAERGHRERVLGRRRARVQHGGDALGARGRT